MSFSRVIFYLFQTLFFVTPLLWLTKTSELFEFPKMLVVYVMSLLIVGAWFLRMVFEKRLIFRRTYLDLPLILFFISQLISTLFSIDPHTSLFGYYSRFHGGLLSTLAYLSLYYAFVSNLSRQEARQSLNTILISGVLGSLYAFPEHFGKSFGCLGITHHFDTNCWSESTNPKYRVFGTFGQPNWLAAYLITIIFLPMAKMVKSGSKKQESGIKPSKILLILESCILFLLFSVLLFTKSRSGLLGLTIGMIVFIALYFYLAFRHRSPVNLKPLISYFLILISCFLVFGRGLMPQTDRLFTLFSQQPSKPATPIEASPTQGGTQMEIGGSESGDIRRIVWTGAFDLWKKYPLFGSGVETFAYGYYQTRPMEHNLVSEWDFLYNKAHNEFLNFLSTTGLFGLGSYLSIILVYSIWSVKQIINRKSYLIYLALLSGYSSLAVSNFLGFSTVPVGLLFFLYPAVAFSLTNPETKDTLPKKIKTNNLTNSQLIISGLILLISGFFILQVINLYRSDLKYTQGKRLGESGQLVNAITLLSQASELNPSEPLFTDELSYNVAKAAISLYQIGDATKAAMIARQAETLSNQVIGKNRVHLNYYKTRARVFAALSTVDNNYIFKALNTLEEATKLAPTDAKLYYNIGIIKEQLGQVDEAAKIYQQTIEMKPNYEAARMSLANYYYNKQAYPEATLHYQYVLTHINPLNDLAASRSATPKP